MNILLIDNYDSFTYNLVHYLEQFATHVEVIRNDQLDILSVTNYDKIMISPGPGLPADSGCIMEVIDKYHSVKPILGICLGLQAIVEYFGGTLYNMPEVKHGVQTQTEILQEDYLFNSIPKSFLAGLYHSWAAQSLPNTLVKTAVSEDDIVMAISHQTYDLKGVQYHPESILTEHGLQMIKNWVNH